MIFDILGGVYEKVTLVVPTTPSIVIAIVKSFPDPGEDHACIHVLFITRACHIVPPTVNIIVELGVPKCSPYIDVLILPFVVVLPGANDKSFGAYQQSSTSSCKLFARSVVADCFVNLPIGQLVQLNWPVVF